MGQYYLTVNLDKGEYLDPHKFGDGLKLLEFGASKSGTICALTILLADGNGRGGGDLRSENETIGSWKGDRIVVAGDYADPHKFVPESMEDELYKATLEAQLERDIDEETAERYAEQNCNVYSLALEFFDDISEEIIEAMKDDGYLKEELEKKKVMDNKRDLKGNLKRSSRLLNGIQGVAEEENPEEVEKVKEIREKVSDLIEEVKALDSNYTWERYS